MDVLVLRQDLDRAVGDLGRNDVERLMEGRSLRVGEDPAGNQPINVGMTPPDVIDRELDVVLDRHRQRCKLWRHPGLETAMPEGHACPPCLLAHVATPRPHRRTKPSASWCRNVSDAS